MRRDTLYVEWLLDIVGTFGRDAVESWREPPDGWTFRQWRARRFLAEAM